METVLEKVNSFHLLNYEQLEGKGRWSQRIYYMVLAEETETISLPCLFPLHWWGPHTPKQDQEQLFAEQEFPSSSVTWSLSNAGRVSISSMCSGCSAHSKVNFLYPFHAAPMSTDVKVGQRLSNYLSKLST